MTDNNSKTKKIRFMSKELKRILTISGVSVISLGIVASVFLVNISANNTSNLNNINNNSLEQNIKNKKVKLFDMFNNKIINFEISEDTKTVRDILENSDYNNNCICNYDLDTPVHENMNIFVRKTVSINIQENNKNKIYFVPENISIKKALELLEINLSEHDIINFNINENIYNNINIIINRISYDEFTYTEPIEYTTVTRKDYTLEKNSKKIISEGQNGERELKIKRKIVDGEIISTEVLSSKITKPAKEHIILIGAKPENNYNYNKNTKNTTQTRKNTKQKLNSEENTNTNIKNTEHEVIKVISGCATAYTDSGGIIRPDGRVITSTGKVPQEGITAAVNPKIIPYGSKIRVRTTDGSFDKILYAQDTGGALRSGSATVDIYMKNKKDCLNFGRRKVEVSVLK